MLQDFLIPLAVRTPEIKAQGYSDNVQIGEDLEATLSKLLSNTGISL